MSKFPSPLASSLGDVEFSRLSADEIKRVSVKRIRVTPTFDSLGGPAPGGLYDPALGAVRALDTT
jgi:DNA-directed RNA polymerase I subunit RPA1